MSVRRIIETFREWSQAGDPIVLATVYDTAGSTYSKAGQRILIRGNGDFQGLVSGGCLEGDLAERARRVLEDGESNAVTYDMRDEADDVFGLGVGCNGMIRVFLQPLAAESGYEPFRAIAAAHLSHERGSVATVVASDDAALPAATTLVWSASSHASQAAPLDRLVDGCRAARDSGLARLESGSGGLVVLYAPLDPVPRLLVLGAGLDAVPLVAMAAELGWLVSVADHRPAYIEGNAFPGAERVSLIEPTALKSEFQLDDFEAVVVMSHHLVTDQIYLQKLASVAVPYIGVLGPRARRDRLVEALGADGADLGARLRGPVGIDIGADSPESIALSVLAEVHAALKGAGGPAGA